MLNLQMCTTPNCWRTPSVRLTGSGTASFSNTEEGERLNSCCIQHLFQNYGSIPAGLGLQSVNEFIPTHPIPIVNPPSRLDLENIDGICDGAEASEEK
ncbi:unnamed protein product, partial [Nesidiocoris tenuis]